MLEYPIDHGVPDWLRLPTLKTGAKDTHRKSPNKPYNSQEKQNKWSRNQWKIYRECHNQRSQPSIGDNWKNRKNNIKPQHRGTQRDNLLNDQLSFRNFEGLTLCQNHMSRLKTNKMTVRPAKTQISLGTRPVWSESSLCAHWVAKDPFFMRTAKNLIWVFAGRTCYFIAFVMRQLICQNHQIRNKSTVAYLHPVVLFYFFYLFIYFFLLKVARWWFWCRRYLSRSMTKPTKWHVHPAKTDQNDPSSLCAH